MTKTLPLLFNIFVSLSLFSQLPNTEVWLLKLKKDKTDKLFLSEAQNISNREGYDNQPSFSEDGNLIYYVSVRKDNQADIYSYDIKKKTTKALTQSKESEYSPQPAAEGNYLLSVVVESDSSQRIHFINVMNGRDEKRLDFDSVGYFCELNQDTLIYYKLTEPHSLRYYIKSTKEDKWLGDSPIRGFKKINRYRAIYGLKDSAKVIFYTYDFLLRKASEYANFATPEEDIFWHDSFGLLKPDGSKILNYDEKKSQWNTLFDLTSFGIKKISRISFDSKNRYLVIVDNL